MRGFCLPESMINRFLNTDAIFHNGDEMHKTASMPIPVARIILDFSILQKLTIIVFRKEARHNRPNFVQYRPIGLWNAPATTVIAWYVYECVSFCYELFSQSGHQLIIIFEFLLKFYLHLHFSVLMHENKILSRT